MSIRCKIGIYKISIRPIMTNAKETSAVTPATKMHLRATEMRRLRSIAGYNLMER